MDASLLITNSKKRMDWVRRMISVSDSAVTNVLAVNNFKTYLSKTDITLAWPFVLAILYKRIHFL